MYMRSKIKVHTFRANSSTLIYAARTDACTTNAGGIATSVSDGQNGCGNGTERGRKRRKTEGQQRVR